jgi:hypothetical protein
MSKTRIIGWTDWLLATAGVPTDRLDGAAYVTASTHHYFLRLIIIFRTDIQAE